MDKEDTELEFDFEKLFMYITKSIHRKFEIPIKQEMLEMDQDEIKGKLKDSKHINCKRFLTGLFEVFGEEINEDFFEKGKSQLIKSVMQSSLMLSIDLPDELFEIFDVVYLNIWNLYTS